MDFGKGRLAKRLPPCTFLKIESPKKHNILNNLPQEIDRGFFEVLPVRWENRLWRWTQLAKNGQNQYFCGKMNNFFLRPASELIFSLKYSSWEVITGKNHPRPEKKLYVEQNDLKMTKNRFLGFGFVTIFRKSHFSTMNIENNYKKVLFAKNYMDNCV